MGKGNSILVTGGAGYIGGQTVLALLDQGFEVCVLDDLSTGHRNDFLARTHFYEGRVHDQALVKNVLVRHGIRSVLHFAGSIKVDESVSNPLKYYENNTEGSRALIEACVAGGVENFIFSSTAAVYGTTPGRPVSEKDTTFPLNPYGWSKLFTERLLEDVAATGALKYGIFRYFNVAGADPDMRHGQYQEKPVHLIGRAIDALLGGAPPLTVFGKALATPDGTGVRDYIHVADVADAHVALLAYLEEGGESRRLNLGYGKGYSVLEVVTALSEIAGRDVPCEFGAARAGEAPCVVANVAALRGVLNWQPKHDTLGQILRHSLDWQEALAAKR
ncbi:MULTISPECIES: UDP-glucose 4-epimerase GalE [Kordiimonas]|uniref:UDP-glucose 4-epimerase GalE n=1 Tax=Kordiimonas TaxID=288021 RepID=UPI00257DF645|nr:UDP-glucose 4-epimerase GalE [Kordiimonas sp. UBA4487]